MLPAKLLVPRYALGPQYVCIKRAPLFTVKVKTFTPNTQFVSDKSVIRHHLALY